MLNLGVARVLREGLQATLRRFGYEVQRIYPKVASAAPVLKHAPENVEPIWPLPRRPGGPSDEEIQRAWAKFRSWHYSYEFTGGLSLAGHHKGTTTAPAERPLQRFRHFMPFVVDAHGGSIQGKRVLDISCNSGFWSIQCALLGANVVGFDVREENIEQANLIKDIVGLDNVEFKVLDFWDMTPEALGGTFDIVLNLGVLYHLPNTLEALALTKSMARESILLDTALHRSGNAVLKVLWEQAHDIQMAGQSGVVEVPSARAIDLMLKHLGVATAFQIPNHSKDLPPDYLNLQRASWLITV